MSVIFMRIAAAIGVLLHVTLSTAEFTSLCSDVYLDKNDANILVTRCTMNGEPSDSHYVWSEFDLNKILGYQAPYIIYQKNGNFSVSNHPCGNCSLAGSTLSCDCPAGAAGLGLDAFLYDVAGVLCYGDRFGPICGKNIKCSC